MTRSGLEVCAAICVMDIDEVFVASMVSSGHAWSNCLNILSFKSTFSVAASTTRLAYSTPSLILVKVEILANVSVFLVSSILSLATKRSKFLVIVAIALVSAV